MTINRNGTEIELTASEIIKAWEEHEIQLYRSEIESIIDDHGYKFDNYAEQGSDFVSAEDFKNDFIWKCAFECMEREISDNEFHSHTESVTDIVTSNAEDFDLAEEF